MILEQSDIALLTPNKSIIGLKMVWVDAEWHGRAMQRVILESRKNLSLTDCLSFEIMEAQEIRETFSFDKHFEEKGFTLTAYSSLDDQPEEGDG